jgi:hypothetical protein
MILGFSLICLMIGGFSSTGYSLRWAIFSLILRIFLVRGDGELYFSTTIGYVSRTGSISGAKSSLGNSKGGDGG